MANRRELHRRRKLLRYRFDSFERYLNVASCHWPCSSVTYCQRVHYLVVFESDEGVVGAMFLLLLEKSFLTPIGSRLNAARSSIGWGQRWLCLSNSLCVRSLIRNSSTLLRRAIDIVGVWMNLQRSYLCNIFRSGNWTNIIMLVVRNTSIGNCLGGLRGSNCWNSLAHIMLDSGAELFINLTDFVDLGEIVISFPSLSPHILFKLRYFFQLLASEILLLLLWYQFFLQVVWVKFASHVIIGVRDLELQFPH